MIATPRLNRLPAAERGITIGDFLVPVSLGERISARARHIALMVAGALFIALTAQVVDPPEPGADHRPDARRPARRRRAGFQAGRLLGPAVRRAGLLPAGLRQP